MQARRTANPAATAQRVTARSFEATQAQRRVEQDYNSDLLRYHATNERIRATMQSDDRVETLRRVKRTQAINSELAMMNGAEEAEKDEEMRRELAQQDAALAKALSEMKMEETTTQARVRRVCESSEEIQTLKAQIMAAQLNKARTTQLAEKEYLKQQESMRQAQLDALMEQHRLQQVDTEEAMAKARHESEVERREAIRQQLIEKQRSKQAAYEQFLKDKAVVDQIVQDLANEDQARMEQYRAKQRELQANIQTYLHDRSVWREQERQRAEAELRAIQDFQRLQEQRYQDELRKKKDKSDAQDAILAQLSAAIAAKRKEEEDMQALLHELYMEEAEQKAEEDERRREAYREHLRREMIDANEQQKAYKLQRAKQQQEEEEAFRTAMMKKFDDDQRLEQMTAARRKREMMEYKAEVERLVQERRAMYEASLQKELEQKRKLEDEEAANRAIIEEERQRLLQEYAAELKDFLPKGVFKSEDDYRAVYGAAPPTDALRDATGTAADPSRSKRGFGKMGLKGFGAAGY